MTFHKAQLELGVVGELLVEAAGREQRPAQSLNLLLGGGYLRLLQLLVELLRGLGHPSQQLAHLRDCLQQGAVVE